MGSGADPFLALQVPGLDDVSDRDDAHETVVGAGDRHLGDPALTHLAHDLLDVVLNAAGDRVTGHSVADWESGEALASIVNDPKHVPFAEDPDELSLIVDDGE